MNIPQAKREESTRHSLTQAKQGEIQDKGRCQYEREGAPDPGVYGPDDLGAIHGVMKI